MPPSRFARLDVWARGQTVGLKKAGIGPTEIAKVVRKPNGQRVPTRAVKLTIQKSEAHPRWRGERDFDAGGRNRPLTAKKIRPTISLLSESDRSEIRF